MWFVVILLYSLQWFVVVLLYSSQCFVVGDADVTFRIRKTLWREVWREVTELGVRTMIYYKNISLVNSTHDNFEKFGFLGSEKMNYQLRIAVQILLSRNRLIYEYYINMYLYKSRSRRRHSLYLLFTSIETLYSVVTIPPIMDMQ